MKKRIATTLAAVLFAIFSTAALATEAPPNFAAASHTEAGLTITARSSKGMYKPGEPVLIDVAVRNTSDATVVVTTRNSCDPGIRAHLLLRGDTEVPLVQAGKENVACAMVMGTTRMEPGATIKSTFSWPAEKAAPGNYTVRVSAEPSNAEPVSTRLFVRIGGFRDMGSHWAAATVVRAAEQGMVAGYPDGTFRPDGSISRGEFTKLLLTARGLRPTGAAVHWAAPWQNTAQTAGISASAGQNLDNPISRIEMTEMIVRSTGLLPNQIQGGADAFTDVAALSPHERFYAEMVRKFGVGLGYADGTFGPKRQSTRAEALVMLVRLNEYLALKPHAQSKVSVGTQSVEAKVLAATDFHPALIQVGPVAAAAGISLSAQADGSWLFSLGNKSLVVVPGSPMAGNVALQRPAELVDGELYVTAAAFTELGATVSVTR